FEVRDPIKLDLLAALKDRTFQESSLQVTDEGDTQFVSLFPLLRERVLCVRRGIVHKTLVTSHLNERLVALKACFEVLWRICYPRNNPTFRTRGLILSAYLFYLLVASRCERRQKADF